MADSDTGRRLSAILMADVVGYSRLMGNDEEGTVQRLKQARDIFAREIERSSGRIVNAPGDSILAEFASVYDAVRAALAIQRGLERWNANIPAAEVMRFRIGLNLGDVVADELAIYGDGVNVAARLESLAEPGGVAVSGSIRDSVGQRLAVAFRPAGEHRVKNIASPVRVYHVVADEQGAVAAPAGNRDSGRVQAASPRVWLLAAIAITLSALLATWMWGSAPPGPPDPGDTATGDAGLPSLAVLPLTNLSGDPSQDYFSDGLTDTLITMLANLRELRVAARSSAFAYKGKSVDARDIGAQLGVRHILEGSVQRGGDRLRVNVRLLDASSGAQLWSHKYDRESADLFDIQDDITDQIIAALDIALVEGEQARSWRASTDDTEAYELFLRGWEARQRLTREDSDRARQLFEQALAIDPDFTAALFGLGTVHMAQAYSGWSDSPATSFEQALTLAERAIAADPAFGGAYDLHGEVLIMYRQDHERGLERMRHAVALTPGSARYNWTLGVYLCNANEVAEGLRYIEQGFHLNPHPPAWFYQGYGRCYLVAGEFERSIAANRRAVAALPDFVWARVDLAMAYMRLDREAEAREQVQEILRIHPNFRTDTHAAIRVLIDQKERVRYRGLLRKAGLP